jgi:hypothetical protein
MTKADISAMVRRDGCRQFLSGRGFAAIAVAILVSGPVCGQEMAPVCHARAVNVRSANKTHMANTDAAGASLCLYRGPTTLHLEVRQTSIAAMLSALASAYNVSYRSSIPLTEIRSGKYTGRVQSVISDILDGYDYAIRHDNSSIEVIVFNKSGGQPVAAAKPVAAPAAIAAERTAAAVTTEIKKKRGEVTVSRSH